MRILFLTNFYPPADMGGWEQWCHEVADAFTARGHEVWVLTSRFGHERIRTEEARIRRLLYLESDIEHYRPLNYFLRTGRHDRHNKQVMRETVTEIDPDVIFVWGMWQLDPRLANQAEAMRPGKVAYYFCGYWPIDTDPHSNYWLAPETKWWASALKRPLARLAMARQAARTGAQPAFQEASFVSHAVQRILEEGGVKFGNTQVIYGGVNLDFFARESTSPKKRDDGSTVEILYAGSLSTAKGVDTLLRAVALLAERWENGRFQLSLAGAGHPQFEMWAREYVRARHLDDYVTFLGRFDHDRMPELLRGFDVLAFPSAWQEPLARMMMEGLASGLALVSTTTGGTGEVIEDGVNGLTFEAGNEKVLARQLGRLISEPGLIEVLARGGLKTATALFDFERMVDDLEAFVGRLVHEHQRDNSGAM